MIKPRIKSSHGFTLIELAVAIFIITLLLGSILVPLQAQVEQRQISDTQKTLDEIKEALIGHAIAYGYLPCPDINNDGGEDVSSNRCSSISSGRSHGNLPWQTLGVASSDVWGNRFRYVVREDYARRDTPSWPFSLNTTSADLRVCQSDASCSPSLTSSAVAIIMTHGKNGYGATSSITGGPNPTPGSASDDEKGNWNNDRDFVSHVMTQQGASAGEFDDIVTWLPLYVLFNRMVSAGKLP